jgi:hypothetical protein
MRDGCGQLVEAGALSHLYIYLSLHYTLSEIGRASVPSN